MIPLPPPPLSGLPAGTRLVAGLGYATVVADIDMETFGLSGYVWDNGKWTGPAGAPKNTKGLPVVGACNYADHESAEVLIMAYDLKDGRGKRRWRKGWPCPPDLHHHIASGGLLEAWNVAFERWMWDLVCVRRLGWPAVQPWQWRCAMAKARAHALPGNLAEAGAVLQLATQKDKRGTELMRKFSMPRNPTKSDPRWRIEMLHDAELVPAWAAHYAQGDPKAERKWMKLLLEDHADTLNYVEYNDTDIASEAEASSLVPDLDEAELAWWQCHETINRRGVHVDAVGISNAIAIIEQAHARYNAELVVLTGIDSASKVAQMQGWLHGRGVHLESLDEENVTEALATPHLPPEARRVLEIRAAVGSASVKKAFAMRNSVGSDGRLHDLYVYHGARTGRSTGEGAQPTNMPKAGPDLLGCGVWVKGKFVDGPGCGQHYGQHRLTCPHCGRPAIPKPPGATGLIEWNPDIAAEAIAQLRSRSLDWLEYAYGDALSVVSGCLRGLFDAAPGHDLICTDYNSIEAIGLAMMAGEQWRIEVFRTHGKIYEKSASMMYGVPFEDFAAHKQRTGQHHPLRQKGKVAELACFGPDTEVLTNDGYVRIADVAHDQQLWDGVEWVNHAGVVPKGTRRTIDLDGIDVTPDHQVLCGTSWKAARQLASSASILSQALETASGSSLFSPRFPTRSTHVCGSSVPAEPIHTSFSNRICKAAKRHVAGFARIASRVRPSRPISSTPTSCQTTSIEDGYSIAWPQRSADATARQTQATPTTASAESSSTRVGEQTAGGFSNTWSRCRAGITRAWTWIVEKLTAPTPPETSGSSPDRPTRKTSERFRNYSGESLTWNNVYDISNAGPRNRFMIRTRRGHLIVHNCGYGGWVGAAAAFEMPGTEEDIKASILAWRKASPSVEWIWGGQTRGAADSIIENAGGPRCRDRWDRTTFYFGTEGAVIQALLNPGVEYPVVRLDGTHTGITYIQRGDALYCRLPSGRPLTYHRPRLQPADGRPGYEISYEGYNTNPKNGPRGWIRMRSWGARFVENNNQAQCACIMRFACINLEAAGYPVVLHVYDEIVSEVPEGWGSHEEFERIVETMPAWARDWPVRAPDSWRAKRYRKAA